MPARKPPEQEGTIHMSFATLMLSAIVLVPLVLLVVDLVASKGPDPAAAPPHGARR